MVAQEEIDRLTARMTLLMKNDQSGDPLSSPGSSIRAEIADLEQRKQLAIKNEQYAAAAEFKVTGVIAVARHDLWLCQNAIVKLKDQERSMQEAEV